VPKENTYIDFNGAKWKGEGNYYVALVEVVDNSFSDYWVFNDGGQSAVKVSFTEALTTLDFSKFYKASN